MLGRKARRVKSLGQHKQKRKEFIDMLCTVFGRLGNKGGKQEVAHALSRSNCPATANQDKQRRLSNKRGSEALEERS